MIRKRLIAMACLTVSGCGLVDGDTRQSIVGEPTCSACSMRLLPVATLQADQAASTPRFPVTVVRLTDGRYAMAPTFERGTASVFGVHGELVGVVGGFGGGPGEMEDVQAVVPWGGDSIAVSHDGSRLSLFDAALRYSRSVILDSPSFLTRDVVPLSDGALLAPRTGTAGGPDVSLREYSSAGEPLRGYGASTNFGSGRIYAAVEQAGDTVWAVDHARYEIDVFSRTTRTARDTIHREIDWFPPDGPRTDWGGRPAIEDLTRYAPGKFLVLLMRPRDDYSLAVPNPSTGGEAAARRQLDHLGMVERFEQLIELLNVEEGQVLARLNLGEQWLGGFIDEDEVYAYEEHPQTGDIGITVWRIEVTGVRQR